MLIITYSISVSWMHTQGRQTARTCRARKYNFTGKVPLSTAVGTACTLHWYITVNTQKTHKALKVFVKNKIRRWLVNYWTIRLQRKAYLKFYRTFGGMFWLWSGIRSARCYFVYPHWYKRVDKIIETVRISQYRSTALQTAASKWS